MIGGTGRLRDWLEAFGEGLIRPSRLSALIAAATFAGMLALAVWFFSAPVLSGPLGRFLATSQGDAEAQATWRAMQLRQAPPDRPQLLILGSSALANAIASEPAMQAELRRSTGRDWSVSILTTPAQSTLDQLTLIESALGPPPGPRRPVVVAIEMSLMREHLAAPRLLELERTGRLGVRSDWTDEAVAELGGAPRPRSGLYWIDNYSFVILHADKTLVRLFLGRPSEARTDIYGPPAPLPASGRQRPKILAELLAPHPARPLVYATIDLLFRHLHAYPHVHVVFVETRLSPDFVSSAHLQPMEAAARSRASSFAAGHASEYWPIVGEAAVPASAYYDDLHIATARERGRIRAALARRLADYIHRRGLG